MLPRGNRVYWNRSSDDYQQRHNRTLTDAPLAWGVWRIPEFQLGILGDLFQKTILEFGCGAAQWTIALKKSGFHVFGLDLSERQLEYARKNMARENVQVPLIQGDGECIPVRSGYFDVVFCDHGVMSFARPEKAIKEVARILRPGGLFAFCMSSPIRDLCWDEKNDTVSDRLKINYFTMEKFEYEESTSYQYGYGKWIRLFVQNGFIIEDLIELRAPQGKSTTYSDFIRSSWARKWPAENIWKVRKTHT